VRDWEYSFPLDEAVIKTFKVIQGH